MLLLVNVAVVAAATESRCRTALSGFGPPSLAEAGERMAREANNDTLTNMSTDNLLNMDDDGQKAKRPTQTKTKMSGVIWDQIWSRATPLANPKRLRQKGLGVRNEYTLNSARENDDKQRRIQDCTRKNDDNQLRSARNNGDILNSVHKNDDKIK